MRDIGQIIRSKIVRIGNSQGIRIPHILLKQLHLDEDVELSVQDDQLVIRAAKHARMGWEALFARSGYPSLYDDLAGTVMTNDWDGAGWEW